MEASGATRDAPGYDPPTEPVPPVAPDGPRRRKRPGGRRSLIAIAAVIVIAAVSVGVWLATRSTSAAPALTVSTETVSVTTGTMKQTVATSGTIDPGREANLDFAVSGAVTAVDVTTGSKVVRGQGLATIDSSALRAQVQSETASLAAATDTLSSDRSDSASTSQIDSDEASVTSAQTQLAAARTDLSDATLVSTIDGTVSAVDLTVGQEVSASAAGSSGSASTSTGGSSGGATSTGASGAGATSSATSSASSSSSSSTAQVTVIDTHSYTVSATVDDTEVGQVKVGDQAVITPGSSTTPVYGTVSSVGLIASDTSDVATFPVVIAVTGSPSGLYAGSTATVSIITRQLDDVVQVPTTAITYSGGSATVTVVEAGRHVATAITTGVTSDGETQVTRGLSAGAKIVERVVTFRGGSGGARSLFGGGRSPSGGFPRGGTGGAGGFGAGGFGGSTGG